MKVTLAPFVSRASGRFGGQVFSSWKGIDLVRRFSPPSNPKTTAQTAIRLIFLNLSKSWVLQTTEVRAAWETLATGKALIGRNLWLGDNVPALQGETDLLKLVVAKGDASTVPLISQTLTPAAGQISCAYVAPAVPTGWTLDEVIFACAADDDFSLTVSQPNFFRWYENTGDASPIVISGLDADDYICAGFIRWLAPDGSTRYSQALGAELETVT